MAYLFENLISQALLGGVRHGECGPRWHYVEL
jgi:hypothetical protein